MAGRSKVLRKTMKLGGSQGSLQTSLGGNSSLGFNWFPPPPHPDSLEVFSVVCTHSKHLLDKDSRNKSDDKLAR